MAIVPDAKDWTWVLQRPCPECGLDTRDVAADAVPAMIRVNAAAAWNFVVVAELINSQAGLGYRIVRAQRFLQTDKIFAVLIVIGVAGLTIDVVLRLVRTQVGKWAA